MNIPPLIRVNNYQIKTNNIYKYTQKYGCDIDTFKGLFSIWAEKKHLSDLLELFIVCFGRDVFDDVICLPREPDVS